MGEERELSNAVNQHPEKKNRKSSKKRAKESENDAAKDERKRAKKEKRRKKESEDNDAKKLDSTELSESKKKKSEKKKKLQDVTDGTEMEVDEAEKLKKKDKRKNRQAEDTNDGSETIHEEETTKREEKMKKVSENLEKEKDSKSGADEKDEETSKRGRKRSASNDDDDDDNDDKEKSSKLKKRKSHLEERKLLREQVPKVDENGISYTKQQIRRMMRRVKKGLSAVPTPEEEAEIKRQEKQLRKEEENLYAGLPEEPKDEGNDDGEPHDDDDDDDEDDGGETDNNTSILDDKKIALEENKPSSQQDTFKKPVDVSKIFKIKTKKAVPPDYVCMACQNSLDVPRHWIYDCPNKVTVRKANKNNQEPSAKKVFVSGLFFDTRLADVKQMFSACGNIASCKILKFQDTKRCKGQAYVTFDTEEAAQKAIKMSGTMITSEKNGNKKDLKLQVSRVLSRSLTATKKRKN